MEVLAAAERGHDPEYRALVVARDGTVAALALFGAVAGTEGAAKLHVALLSPGVSATDVGARLLDAVAATMRGEGARFLLAELPDDPAVGRVVELLRGCGFREEGRAPDFYRDGVALVFWRREL